MIEHRPDRGGPAAQARNTGQTPKFDWSSCCAGLVRSGPGTAILQGWSYTSDDVTEIEERLQQMASCYDADDDADAF